MTGVAATVATGPFGMKASINPNGRVLAAIGRVLPEPAGQARNEEDESHPITRDGFYELRDAP